jgi:mannose-6-phosphate isomerase
MTNLKLYPFKFEPIYQYRLWGGRRLENLLSKPLPSDEPVGEAWILSDRDDHASLVTEGALKGYTLTQLLEQSPEELMGKLANHFDRFPLLLKFLDCKEVLSVQVHPSDDQTQYIPKGDTGKTEAWVVVETAPECLIYAGLTPGTTADNLKAAIADHQVAQRLHSFTPKVGDAVFIHSGTVHTLKGAVVFEVQENSDTTFRLYDWDRTDEKTGKPRELQVDEAIACIDFNQVNIEPVMPVADDEDPFDRERVFNDNHFILWRIKTEHSFTVGAADEPRILVCIEGNGKLIFEDEAYTLSRGEVMLIPAAAGRCRFEPSEKINLLEIGVPDIQK